MHSGTKLSGWLRHCLYCKGQQFRYFYIVICLVFVSCKFILCSFATDVYVFFCNIHQLYDQSFILKKYIKLCVSLLTEQRTDSIQVCDVYRHHYFLHQSALYLVRAPRVFLLTYEGETIFVLQLTVGCSI